MALPPRDDPRYEQRREAYNDRRRRRREDPEYKSKENARQVASRSRRRKGSEK